MSSEKNQTLSSSEAILWAGLFRVCLFDKVDKDRPEDSVLKTGWSLNSLNLFAKEKFMGFSRVWDCVKKVRIVTVLPNSYNDSANVNFAEVF